MNSEQHTTTTYDARLIGFSTVAAILGATFAIAMSTSAATEDTLGGGRGGCDPERREQVEEAIEAGDYDRWKALLDEQGGWRGRMSEVVTKENFDTYAAMHEAVESGDTERTTELRNELGLPERTGKGGRHGMRGYRLHASNG